MRQARLLLLLPLSRDAPPPPPGTPPAASMCCLPGRRLPAYLSYLLTFFPPLFLLQMEDYGAPRPLSIEEIPAIVGQFR